MKVFAAAVAALGRSALGDVQAAGIRAAARQAGDTAPVVRVSAQVDFVATLVLGLAGTIAIALTMGKWRRI